MSDYRVTVFGGTGFLGRNVVYCLLRKGFRVRVVARNTRSDLFKDSDNPVEQVRGDVRDNQSVSDAIKGVDGVVNAVGLYVERHTATFNAVHIEGAQRIAEQTVASGAKLVHISGSVPILSHHQSISGPGRAVNNACAKRRRTRLS